MAISDIKVTGVRRSPRLVIDQFLGIFPNTVWPINFNLGTHCLLGEIQKLIDLHAAIMDFKVTRVENDTIIVTPSVGHPTLSAAFT